MKQTGGLYSEPPAHCEPGPLGEVSIQVTIPGFRSQTGTVGRGSAKTGTEDEHDDEDKNDFLPDSFYSVLSF